VIIGVDTHKDVHTAVAINTLGTHLAAKSIPTNSRGYQSLETWATSLGPIQAIGIEGTGSYGAALSRFMRERGYAVLEVNRPNRQLRHQKGKSDTVDAERRPCRARRPGNRPAQVGHQRRRDDPPSQDRARYRG
jgi:transposase